EHATPLDVELGRLADALDRAHEVGEQYLDAGLHLSVAAARVGERAQHGRRNEIGPPEPAGELPGGRLSAGHHRADGRLVDDRVLRGDGDPALEHDGSLVPVPTTASERPDVQHPGTTQVLL